MKIATEETVLAWQGVPVQVKYGYCIVEPDKEKPLNWWNYHCRETGIAKLAAVCVNSGGYVFCIYNGYGIGWYKLSKGGWPNEGHADLPVDTFKEDDSYKFTQYDQLSFSRELHFRRQWQKETYPEEYKRIEALMGIIDRTSDKPMDSEFKITRPHELYSTPSLIDWTPNITKPKHHNGRYNKVNRSKNKASRKARKQNRR